MTIQSQDTGNPAIMNNFEVYNSKGLQFNNLEFAAKGTDYVSFQVTKSQDIGFDNVSVHGSMDNNPQNDGQGIGVQDSSNIRITNSEFQQLARGISVSRSSDIVVSGNDLHDLRTTGFVAAEVVGIKISDNSFTNFKPLPDDHPDAIQFMTSGTTTVSRNIEILNNIITKGTGAPTQGIFLRDEVGTLHYENLTIAGNMVVGTGYGGIYVIGVKNLVVADNDLVTTSPESTNATWGLIENAEGAKVTGNDTIWISYLNVNGLVQSSNVQSAPVTDGGKAAIQAWIAAHPDGDVSTPVPPTTVPPIVVEPPPVVKPPPIVVEPPPVVKPPPIVVEPPIVAEPPRPIDAITSNSTIKLSASDNNLSLTGRSNVDGYGNDKANVLTGNNGNNHLYGGAGNDTMTDGGGADTMAGGTGDDAYYVNNFQKKEMDVIVEKANEGVDTVYSTSSFKLPNHVENLVLTLKGGDTGEGNNMDNKITGNVGANILNGYGGNDTINGGGGNDSLGGHAGNDVLTGGAGNDMFHFMPGGGKDIVTDFGANGDQDTIDISNYLMAGLKPTVTDVGNDVVISFRTGESITLVGVELHDLSVTAKGFMAV
ncbi:MAG: right-handed parallel beta-helix repeat-containing protein [Pseudomonadota bacterium]